MSEGVWDDRKWLWGYANGTGLLLQRGRTVRYERVYYVPSQRENVTYRRCRISAIHAKPL